MINVVSTPTKQVTCYKCKSILEYTYQDTKEVKSTDYTGHSDTSRGFNCPVCETFVKVR